MTDIRVAVAVVADGTWRAETGTCIAHLVQSFYEAKYEQGDKDIRVIPVWASVKAEARHRALYEAVQWGATHLLWVAPDVTFPPWAVNAFLNHNVPVVAANTVAPTLPARQTAYVEDEEAGFAGPLVTEEGERGLVQVEHAAFDFMLTDMGVYDALEIPMFEPEPMPPNNLHYRDEHVVFCDRLRAAGIPIAVDQKISQKVDKIGAVVYTHGMADISQAEVQRRFKATIQEKFDRQAEAAE